MCLSPFCLKDDNNIATVEASRVEDESPRSSVVQAKLLIAANRDWQLTELKVTVLFAQLGRLPRLPTALTKAHKQQQPD